MYSFHYMHHNATTRTVTQLFRKIPAIDKLAAGPCRPRFSCPVLFPVRARMSRVYRGRGLMIISVVNGTHVAFDITCTQE